MQRVLVVLAILLLCWVPRAHAQAPADTSAEEDADAKTRTRARGHFQRGLEHMGRNEWDAALPEFLKSRELYPTRSNTQNAAVALVRLERHDEALDMFDALLREFRDIPEAELDEIGREMKKLLARVGTIELRTTIRGATVIVDGRIRGTTPLRSKVRVKSGTHVVRVYKEGAAPFELRVEVAAGANEIVTARLVVLQSSGRLKVAERAGRTADVLVDGVVVGKTPWEGSVAPGKHAVSLKGPGKHGAPPVSAPVRADDLTVLSLSLEPLECELRVDLSPANAAVAIDRVDVGRGSWQGRLRCGTHRVEVAAEGFLPAPRTVSLRAGSLRVESIELERNPESEIWKASNPSRVFVELDAAGVATNSLGGDLADHCDGSCSAGPVAGGIVTARGGYHFGSGIGVGVAAGYLWARQQINSRSARGQFVPGGDRLDGIVDDRLTLSGLTLGVDASLQRGTSWRWMVRLGTGVLLGRIADQRKAELRNGGVPGTYGPLTDTFGATYAYVAPEFRVGPRLGRFDLAVGVRPLLLVAIAQPRFDPAEPRQTSCPQVSSCIGFVEFEREKLMGSPVFLLSLGLSARYSFL